MEAHEKQMNTKFIGRGAAAILLCISVSACGTDKKETVSTGVNEQTQIKQPAQQPEKPKEEDKTTGQSEQKNQPLPASNMDKDTNGSNENQQETEKRPTPPPPPASKEKDKTVSIDGNGKVIVTNASSVTVLVNKKRNLPADYEPTDLVVPNVAFSFAGDSPKKQLRRSAARALEALFAQAKKDRIDLKAVSGYRSYSTQKAIFSRNAKKKGKEVANRTSAYPGQSEHQTGLAMDVSSASVSYGLEQRFGNTKEGKWLAKNAPAFGFIIRYPKDKESITGYSYEPWHIRYVGKDIAQAVANRGVTLEEYFGEAVPVKGKQK
ncbi:hypothetical protein AMI01nite_16720 [Aneurinibacillus migulanus]|nr:hypothetical protein AMI01nite_16720 [Aneurinibacillus migulanus]